MTYDQIFEEIKRYVLNKRVSALEKKRMTADLAVIYDRLIKKDYQKFSNTRNKFDVPDRTREIYTEVNFYCMLGENWERILQPLNLSSKDTIADLCPGFAPKIELGLFYLRFAGIVDILDKDSQAVTSLKNFLRLFKPLFTINYKKVNIFRYTGPQYKIVLANHIIDDLVMYYFATKKGLRLQQIYEIEDEYIKLWEEITSDQKNSLNQIVPQLANILNQVTSQKGILVLAHYKSYMEKLLGMDHVTKFNKEVFNQLIHQLEQNYSFVRQDALHKQAFKNNLKSHIRPSDVVFLSKKQ